MSKHRVAILVASTAFASTLTGSADAAKRRIVYYTIASGSEYPATRRSTVPTSSRRGRYGEGHSNSLLDTGGLPARSAAVLCGFGGSKQKERQGARFHRDVRGDRRDLQAHQRNRARCVLPG